jgi:phosphatidylglycerophosphate synthase
VSPAVGWGLAVLGIAAGYVGWGWPGVVLGITVTVFWLLLQFSRSLRVLKGAAGRPVGHVDSAVMLHSKLQRGLTLMQVLRLTRSLGTRLGESPERWGWADPGGARVSLLFDGGKLQSWELIRADGAEGAEGADSPPPLPPPSPAA